MRSPLPTEQDDIFSVSQLNAETHHVLENHFKTIWVTGEISNLMRPSSGHCYFSLKDAKAQVRCALFRLNQRGLTFALENGQQVLVRASASVYVPRGDYQLIIQSVHLAGEGQLQLLFNQRKQAMAEAGLFDAAHKKPIPHFPRCIGVVTSPTGAAIRDILTVLKRRFAAIDVIVYPVPVQGEHAAEQIAQAIAQANQRAECDVLIVGRGGGSLEDLWAFNETPVVNAMFNSQIPIITGIGHKTDVTLSDYVADLHAATPSAAAEQASPDGAAWQKTFMLKYKTLLHVLQHQLNTTHQHLAHLQKRLRHPGQTLQQQAQRLDQLEKRLRVTLTHALSKQRYQFDAMAQRFLQQTPQKHIMPLRETVQTQQHRLFMAFQQTLQQKKSNLETLTRALDGVSPLKTLSRGYAILTSDQNKLIDSVKQVKPNDTLTARVQDGIIDCTVIDLHEN